MIVTSYIADLHIHSRYSRATSKASNLYGLACWAAIKGIDVVGTGDFTHPGWFAHLVDHLEPAEPGFFRLKQTPDYTELTSVLPPGVQPNTSAIRFVLSSEISSIYKRGGKVRKVHNILYAPDFDSVRRINTTLAGIGNLESDGRPILGLDSQLLLEILLENAPQGFLVPAHIWTPWFSLFGSKSGFDAIEECFGDLSREIFALETGLSSDPAMNRCISALDRFSLISNSDCHSPSKLGREANILTTGFDFFALQEAFRHPCAKDGKQRFAATIEFYPEEGKYHCDGHRKCGVCLEPDQTMREKGICPQCGRPLTIGVLYRVMELADRSVPVYPQGSPAVHSLIPLPEMLGELFNVGPASKKVAGVYGKLMNTFGSEFTLLLETPLADISAVSPMLSEAVKRVRADKVYRTPGFDGEFGVIKVFSNEERASFGGQLSLFGITPAKPRKKKIKHRPIFALKSQPAVRPENHTLNEAQQAAVKSSAGRMLVKAGPGTGKTHTLVQRVKRLLATGQGPVTVITFTRKAAAEIRSRLAGVHEAVTKISVDTFHGFCLHWLRCHDSELQLIGSEMRTSLVKQVYPELSARQRRRLQRDIGFFLAEQERLPRIIPELMQPFFAALRQRRLLDLDEVIPACTALMEDDSAFTAELSAAVGHLLVDEFQDLNAGQYALVRMLAKSCSVFAIGDPDQAIYGFRGSRPIWFQHFITTLQPELHVLSVNYRSGADILKAAERVIAGNYSGNNLEPVHAAAASRGVIYQYKAADAGAEAAFIADQIQRLVGGTSHREIDRLADVHTGSFGLSDIAVLYRTGKQAKCIAEALARRSLSCQVVDVSPFYTTGAARILFYRILLAAGSIDRAELLLLLAHEQGIGVRSLEAVDHLLADSFSDPLAELNASLSQLEPKLQAKIGVILDVGQQCAQVAEKQSVAAAVTLLCELYAMDKEDPDIVRLHDMAVSAISLNSFADHLRSSQNSIVYDERAESVLLATLHAAKGLEFDVVFLAGCEEGLLPLASREKLSVKAEKEHLQEERRLFFVGMTRAAKVLYMSAAADRIGFTGSTRQLSSRFIAEIPDELISPLPDPPEKRRKKTTLKQLRLF